MLTLTQMQVRGRGVASDFQEHADDGDAQQPGRAGARGRDAAIPLRGLVHIYMDPCCEFLEQSRLLALLPCCLPLPLPAPCALLLILQYIPMFRPTPTVYSATSYLGTNGELPTPPFTIAIS